MGSVRCGAVLLLCLSCWKSVKENPANLFYFKLNLLGLALYTCASFIPLVSRLGYYLITPHLLLVPGILCTLAKNGKGDGQSMSQGNGGRERRPDKRKLLHAAVLLFCVLYFIYFLLTAHQEGVRVLPYHTWIFTEREWLNGSYIF